MPLRSAGGTTDWAPKAPQPTGAVVKTEDIYRMIIPVDYVQMGKDVDINPLESDKTLGRVKKMIEVLTTYEHHSLTLNYDDWT